MKKTALTLLAFALLASSGNMVKAQEKSSDMRKKVEQYAPYHLKYDINKLDPEEQELVGIFIEIAQVMDDLFWEQSFGLENKKKLRDIDNPSIRKFAEIQYGAWDRLDGNRPFVPGYKEKPLGANFYPADMTKAEFERIKDPAKKSPYTILRRNIKGEIDVIPYAKAYDKQLAHVDELLDKAIEICKNEEMRHYLKARKEDLHGENFFNSDMIWMDMKDSRLDFIFGPIENYEDALFGYKTAYEAFVLVKDVEWSNQLAKFKDMLPLFQKELPCDPKYKTEKPGTESDLNVYDVLYYAGNCNAGSKTIAVNLPNDEKVQLEKGTRRLQLKNAMEAKFEQILLPIAKLMISERQFSHVKFNAFFSNVCYHEVAHGLGVKKVVGSNITVREALKEQYSAWEEAKADICGLYIVKSLIEKGEIKDITVEDAYVTYLAGLLRSVRFGAAEAHGVANMMCFNFLKENKAFVRNKDGRYEINRKNMDAALEKWAALVIQTEGDGDYSAAKKYADINGVIHPELASDLKKIEQANIPIDIVFEQGHRVLRLKRQSQKQELQIVPADSKMLKMQNTKK